MQLLGLADIAANPGDWVEVIAFHYLSWKYQEKINNASKIASTSALLEYLIPASLENKHNTTPLLSRNTPQVPTRPGLPLTTPAALNLSTPEERGDQGTTLLDLLDCLYHTLQIFESLVSNLSTLEVISCFETPPKIGCLLIH